MLQARFLRNTTGVLILVWLLALGSGSISALHAQNNPGQTQPKASALPVIEIKAGAASIHTEVARSPEEKELGLMFRTTLPDNNGMIFIFEEKKRASFWMKNTRIPLSIAFIDSQGVILEIADMQAMSEQTVNSASDQVAFALEVNQHWFALNKIKAGDHLSIVGSNWNALAHPKP